MEDGIESAGAQCDRLAEIRPLFLVGWLLSLAGLCVALATVVTLGLGNTITTLWVVVIACLVALFGALLLQIWLDRADEIRNGTAKCAESSESAKG